MYLGRRAAMIVAGFGLPRSAHANTAADAAPGEPPVRLIAPFSTGGAADIAARTFATHAMRHLAGATHPILVENMPGASGALGSAAVARAAPDGYTLLLARVGASAILPAMDARTPYGVDDFTWIALLDENPFVICVRADAPWRSLPELLQTLRDGTEQVRFATSGSATILDLGVRKMLVLAGLPIDAADAVATRGGGDALDALLAGEAQFAGNNLGDMMPAIRQGSVRVLAVSGNTRLPELPGVPTTTEAGLPDMAELAGWSALAAPPNLPETVRLYWEGVAARTGADPAWIAATRAVGSIPRVLIGQEARAHVLSQVEFYRELNTRLNLTG